MVSSQVALAFPVRGDNAKHDCEGAGYMTGTLPLTFLFSSVLYSYTFSAFWLFNKIPFLILRDSAVFFLKAFFVLALQKLPRSTLQWIKMSQ